MKKTLIVACAIILFLVLMVTTVLDSGDDGQEKCRPSGGSASAGGPASVNAEGLAQPMDDAINAVTSGFGPRDGTMHNGTDIAKANGDPIYAVADGTVAQAGPASGFGQWIIIDHVDDNGERYSTVYGHMFPEGIHVKTGDKVKAGQHIADQGYNGGVDPPGPQGGHLHIEHWPGGRLTGGSPVDAMPLLEAAAKNSGKRPDENKDSDKDKETDESSEPSPSTSESSPADSGKGLPPSDKIADENHLQVDSIRVARSVALRFPQVETIGGWRASDPYPDHPSGRAVDIMIPNYDTGDGKKLGDDIRDYLFGNREEFNIEYMIWRQEYIPSEGQPNIMEDRGSDTQNHFDHVHVTTVGGGMPKPGQDFGDAPDGGSSVPGSAGSGADDCLPGLDASLDADLNDGEIPEELRRWIKLGGRVCKEVSSPLLAGLIEHESIGFQATAESPVGAQGYAQFMPDTWAGAGAEVDENGEVIGPPGSGSPSDPADATMAAARYLCNIAKDQKEQIASGEIKGDPTELMLAGYNAGSGAVQKYGGVPPYEETQSYVKIVPEKAKKYADKT